MRPIIQATLTIQKVGKPDLTVQTTCQSAVSKSFVVEDDLGKTYLENALPILQSLKQKLPDKFRNMEIQEKKTAAQ
ncbi:hypothetical protein IM774_10430 [Erysipelotrichaceae bacterium RD49]|nr:hypothetical protein [Erysipelotrichaceae bacterium RD49]